MSMYDRCANAGNCWDIDQAFCPEETQEEAGDRITGSIRECEYYRSRVAQDIIINFLEQLSSETNTHSTAKYRYYSIEEPYEALGNDEYDYLDYYIYTSLDDPEDKITQEEYDLLPEMYDEEQDKLGKENYNKVPIKIMKRYKGCFLSEQEAHEHLESNNYNYHKDSKIYCDHFYRTPKQDNFLNALFDYFQIEKPKG